MPAEPGQGDRGPVEGLEAARGDRRRLPARQRGPNRQGLLVTPERHGQESEHDEDREEQSHPDAPLGAGWTVSPHGFPGARSRSNRAFNACAPPEPTNPPAYASTTTPSAPMKTVVGTPITEYASITFSSGDRTTK